MKIFKVSTILMIAIMVMAGAVSAAPARIASITDHIDGPFRVAVDASGNLYVTETQKSMVVIYSSEGRYLRSFSVPGPRGIAVDAAGMIYVGSGNSVALYTPDLVFVRNLDSGDLIVPNDIAVGSDGKVYVVSKGNILNPGLVKAYDPAAGTSFTLSGSFASPNAIAVSDTAGGAGEIYIIDKQVITGVVHNRIQVFDKSGQFLRSFEFMAGSTTLKPQGIAVDIAGLLYVVDSTTNGVFVLNPADGSSVTFFSDPKAIMRTPLGIAVTKNGLVYAASSVSDDDNDGKGRIDVFALDGYVTMAVDPLSLAFAGKQSDGNLVQTIVISNTSNTTNGGTLNWSATADKPWIALGSQLPIGPNSAVGLAVGVNLGLFTAGTDTTGKITIDSGSGQKKDVNVTVSVLQPSLLNITGSLNFNAVTGTTPAAQLITIAVSNLTSSVSWSVASDKSWLTVTPPTGAVSPAAPSSTASVSVNTTLLSVGSYTGALKVTTVPPVTGSGSSISVNLIITSSVTSGKITVTTSPGNATFTISGTAPYIGSGPTWSVNAAAGDYTVTYNDVPGYRKPAPQTKTLVAGGEITFNGKYISLKKNIVVAKGPGIKNDSQLKVYKNNGVPVAFDLVALATRYGANVAVGDVDGDGVAEIIAGAGDGPNNPATVRIYRADKTLLTEFTPFATLNGVRVVAADLDGDGKAEVIVAPAGGADNTGRIAAYAYDTVQNKMIATGIDFTAHTYPNGANIAVADIDGNGKPVIITAPGPGKQNPALIKVWKIDTTQSVGSWSATWLKDISLPGTQGASVAAGDVDGDGKSEIIAGTSGDHAMVTIIKADGSQSRFKVSDTNGVTIAAADLDGDGNAEIITATGAERSDHDQDDDAKSKNGDKMNDKKKDGKEKEAEYSGADQERGAVRVFSASGALLYAVVPFEDARDGISVAVGDLGL